jgi:predicted acetyltransferase
MTDHAVRPLGPGEVRAAGDLFRSTLYVKPSTDEEWGYGEGAYQPGRTLGAFDTDLIGTARSFDSALLVPGGRWLPMAAVTGVGVRPDRTRRGVLSELMRAQLGEFAERGVAVASLYATEGPIYGRFGYGVATLGKSYDVDRRRARLRPDAPAGGEITLLGLQESLEQLPKLYDDLPHARPGAMTRPSYAWPNFDGHARRSPLPVHTAVFRGQRGVEGFACYSAGNVGSGHEVVEEAEVHLMHTTTPAAFAGLWRFLLSLDLIARVKAHQRPMDEPLELILEDPRRAETSKVDDATWLRLVDVEAALSAREYTGDGSVVLEVTDALLPGNSGRYRVAADGVERTTAEAGLRLDVAELAMLYLGSCRASSLAAAGRLEVTGPDALTTADLLFGTRVSAWCGSFF